MEEQWGYLKIAKILDGILKWDWGKYSIPIRLGLGGYQFILKRISFVKNLFNQGGIRRERIPYSHQGW